MVGAEQENHFQISQYQSMMAQTDLEMEDSFRHVPLGREETIPSTHSLTAYLSSCPSHPPQEL